MKIKDLIKKFGLLDKEDEVSFILENRAIKDLFINFSNLKFQHFNLKEKEIQIVLIKQK